MHSGSVSETGRLAIQIKQVTQLYRLFETPGGMIVDALGLSRFLWWRSGEKKVFKALDNISINIKRGERVGIIGRNGAGKTTLLKLITQNYQASSGEVIVNGQIQSLMDQGVGFHPEFTGRENIRSALIYNGILGEEAKRCEQEIVDFVELGDFIDQPLKTYSLGMKARLGFAAATAIKPEILIVDEVLGAGDAYFSSKSAIRMKRLTSQGVTLLLVSHSNSQILQFCDRAIWLEQGRIVADGPALEVVKQYDVFIREMESEKLGKDNLTPIESNKELLKETYLKSQATPLSRWTGSGELKIELVRFLDSTKSWRSVFNTGESFHISLSILAIASGKFKFKAVLYVFSADGRPLMLFTSGEFILDGLIGERSTVLLTLPRLQLGTGEYVVSAALYSHLDYDDIGSARFYDLVDRSYKFKVYNNFESDQSQFTHPCDWEFRKAEQ